MINCCGGLIRATKSPGTESGQSNNNDNIHKLYSEQFSTQKFQSALQSNTIMMRARTRVSVTERCVQICISFDISIGSLFIEPWHFIEFDSHSLSYRFGSEASFYQNTGDRQFTFTEVKVPTQPFQKTDLTDVMSVLNTHTTL